jgi:hypothetical protein
MTDRDLVEQGPPHHDTTNVDLASGSMGVIRFHLGDTFACLSVEPDEDRPNEYRVRIENGWHISYNRDGTRIGDKHRPDSPYARIVEFSPKSFEELKDTRLPTSLQP